MLNGRVSNLEEEMPDKAQEENNVPKREEESTLPSEPVSPAVFEELTMERV